MTIRLGYEVKDIVTGFTGIAVAKIEYLNGCVQFCVKPPINKDGKIIEGEYIDIGQLERLGTGIIDDLTAPPGPGGVMPDAPRRDRP